jgi:hypothetical protein
MEPNKEKCNKWTANGLISIFYDQYYDKWNICPPIGSDMADNVPLIPLVDEPACCGGDGA